MDNRDKSEGDNWHSSLWHYLCLLGVWGFVVLVAYVLGFVGAVADIQSFPWWGWILVLTAMLVTPFIAFHKMRVDYRQQIRWMAESLLEVKRDLTAEIDRQKRRAEAAEQRLQGKKPQLVISFVKQRHTQVGDDHQLFYRFGVVTSDGSSANGVQVELASIRITHGGTQELTHKLRRASDCPLARKHDRKLKTDHDLPPHEIDFDLIYETAERELGSAGSVVCAVGPSKRTPDFWAIYFGITWPPLPSIPRGEYELTVRASSASAETATAVFHVRPNKAGRLVVNRMADRQE